MQTKYLPNSLFSQKGWYGKDAAYERGGLGKEVDAVGGSGVDRLLEGDGISVWRWAEGKAMVWGMLDLELPRL